MTPWWRRLPRRRRLGLLAIVVIAVGWFVVPGIWWALALVLALGTNLYLEARQDRNYLSDARARDVAEGELR